MRYIKELSDVTRDDLAFVGGKAASLGTLARTFPVPKAVCLTVRAFRYFLEVNGIGSKIHGILDSSDTDDLANLESASKQIRALIDKAAFPEDLILEITIAIEQFEEVAVRSSATLEDLPNASFAGQHQTFLNIKGKKKILESIKGCWASLYVPHAMSYRDSLHFIHREAFMGVIIQEMIHPEYAGVMFTIDPVNRSSVLIETVKGTGEKLVSGTITPNTYFIDRKDLTIIDKSEHFESTADIREIAGQGLAVEKHMGSPQDIEFAVAGGKILFLQSRPITT